MLRIAIADDHTLFRKSLTLLVNTFEGMQIVLEASNGKELLEQLPATPIDILLLDLQMPVMDGFETNEKIQELFPDIKVLILTQLNERDTINRIIETGVQGYFTKNTDPSELENAITKLNDGGFYFENSLASIIQEIINGRRYNIKQESILVHFSEREKEILELTLREYSAVEISDLLCISPKTVETHKNNLIKKTESKNFIGVITYALSRHIILVNNLKRQ